MSSSRSLGLSLVTLLVAVALVGSAAAENPIDLSGEISFESHDGLYVVSANGGTPTKIPGTRVGDGDPALSPDGTQYAFDREQPGAKLNADGDIPRDVYVMQRDGSGVRQLTFNSSDDGWPQWSPSGRSLSFWSDRRGGGIYVVDVESCKAAGSPPGHPTEDCSSRMSSTGSSWSGPMAPDARRSLCSLATS
jgi:dipeptidyl aminopeptidase/acylaminoacyl peptidase